MDLGCEAPGVTPVGSGLGFRAFRGFGFRVEGLGV